MDSSNSPSAPGTRITEYDSDATDEQSWDLVGSTHLKEAGGSYVGALELAVRSLKQQKSADPDAVEPDPDAVETAQEAAPVQEAARLPSPGEIVYRVDGKCFHISNTISTDTVLGPWIWEKVRQALGNVSLETAWRTRIEDLRCFSLPGPWPFAVVPCTRFSSLGRDFTREAWLDEVQRTIDASQTFLRLKGVTDPALIYPWVRVQSSTKLFSFAPDDIPIGVFHGWTYATNPSLRLRELQHFLRALSPGMDVWFVSIGVDGLTTAVQNLYLLRYWYPFLRFHLAILEKPLFPLFRNGRVDNQNGLDLCPARPEVQGIRVRIFSFDNLLDPEVAGLDLELRLLWETITDAKNHVIDESYSFTKGRNRFPVRSGGNRFVVPR